MAISAAILLGIYGITITLALLRPTRQRDPQMGMAIGCLMMTLLGLGAVGGVLRLGVWLEQRWLVTAIFWFTVCPVILLTLNLVYNTWKKITTK